MHKVCETNSRHLQKNICMPVEDVHEHLANNVFCFRIICMNNPSVKVPLKPTTLKAAGMLAIASAMLTVPMFMLSFMLEGRYDTTARSIHLVLQGVGTVIFVLLIVSFRIFLNRNCGFYRVNMHILGLTVINLVYAAASFVSISSIQGEEQMRPYMMVMVSLLGIIQAGLGWRLFDLENDLFGMKRPYCWLNVVSGVFFATILMIPIAIITSAVADLMLGTILIMEARRLTLPLEATRNRTKTANRS